MNSVTRFIKKQKYIEKFKKPKEKRIRKTKTRLDLLAIKITGKTYDDFLKSDYWVAVRNIILKRDMYMCTICKSGYNLQVHHDSYKNHFHEHEHLDELTTLCAKCHQDYHNNIEEKPL